MCIRDRWYRKRVAVFTVGMTGLEEAEYFQSVLDGNFSVQQQADVCFFHFRGRIDYKQLSFMHRMMMGMLKKMLLGKQEKTESDRQILATYGKKLDGVKCDAVRSLSLIHILQSGGVPHFECDIGRHSADAVEDRTRNLRGVA